MRRVIVLVAHVAVALVVGFLIGREFPAQECVAIVDSSIVAVGGTFLFFG